MTLNAAETTIVSQEKKGFLTIPLAVVEALKAKKMNHEQKNLVIRYAKSVQNWNKMHAA
jgi:hypothetical protein